MLSLPGSADCFVCGNQNRHGLNLAFSYDEASGEVRCEHVATNEFIGFPRYVHGAVVSAMFDEGCSWPIIYRIGVLCMTAQLNVTFKRPVIVGQKLRLVAKEVPSESKSQRKFTSTGTLTNEDGVVVAAAEAIYVALDPSISMEMLRTMDFSRSGVSLRELEARAAAFAAARAAGATASE